MAGGMVEMTRAAAEWMLKMNARLPAGDRDGGNLQTSAHDQATQSAGRRPLTCDQETDGGWSEDGGDDGEELVEHEEFGDGRVLLGDLLGGTQQVHDVGQGGRTPTPPLG